MTKGVWRKKGNRGLIKELYNTYKKPINFF